MGKGAVRRRLAPQPQNEDHDDEPHADDEPAVHILQHRKGHAEIVGAVKRQEWSNRNHLLQRQIGFDQLLDDLVQHQCGNDQRKGRTEFREQCRFGHYVTGASSRRCRRASNSMTAVAMARLRLSARPCWGMRASWSAFPASSGGRPDCSLPIKITTGLPA
ncbi:hypothetical protein D3C72_993300 [compost metagenome]